MKTTRTFPTIVLGTVLLASPETVGPDYAIPALLKARSTDTVYTDVFDKARHQPWPTRWFGRALTNDFTDRWHDGDGVDHAVLQQPVGVDG